jgi:hypothetical protein
MVAGWDAGETESTGDQQEKKTDKHAGHEPVRQGELTFVDELVVVIGDVGGDNEEDGVINGEYEERYEPG